MRVVGRVTGRGGCRERGREKGEDNWGRGVVKVHQRISAVGREGGEMEKGRGRGRGRGKVMEREGVGRGSEKGMEEEGHRGKHVMRGTIMEGEARAP